MIVNKEKTTSEWLTPPEIIKVLGPFDLDPCSPVNRPWDTAKEHYSTVEDGLVQPWYGRVWLNPPYGSETKVWLEQFAAHGSGIALTFARTATKWFHRLVFNEAHSILFYKGFIRFHYPDGQRALSSVSPHCFISYSKKDTSIMRRVLKSGRLEGKLIRLN